MQCGSCEIEVKECTNCHRKFASQNIIFCLDRTYVYERSSSKMKFNPKPNLHFCDICIEETDIE